MTARCALCARRLRVPSPDGYGPRCRTKLRAVRTAGRADVLGPAAVSAHAVIPGQTAIPVQEPLPVPYLPYWPAVIDGRHVTDLPTGDRL